MKRNSVNAAVMTAPGKFEVRRYPYPEIDDVSMVIELEMCGLCGTDKHIFKGEAPEIRGKSIFPYVGGHEVIGTVVEIGENAARTMDHDRQPLRPGDRVAIATRNFPEWVVAFWASQAIGAVAVPLNAWWTGAELAYGLADSGSVVCVADDERAQRVAIYL